MIPRRMWVAFFVAPMAAVAVLTAAGVATLVARGEPVGRTLAGASHASFFFAFFGLPLSYAVELFVGLALQALGRDLAALRPRQIVAVAAGVGSLVMVLIGVIGFPSSTWDLATLALLGTLMGGATGVTFARIAAGRSAVRKAI